MSGMTRIPLSRKTGSAAGVVGPFAPSRMIFALTRGAFSAVNTPSRAAGISTSQSISSAAALATELGGVVADVAEPLHDDFLTFQSEAETKALHVRRLAARLA